MVTISFLLITAVWTNMGRIDADAQVRNDCLRALMPIERDRVT
jgi:hypothetical protein